MPTPTSGAISMLNMRSEITRGAGAISMTEVRTRFGGSGAISFGDLRKCEGFIVTCGTISDKFFSFDGFHKFIGPTGSVAPAEANGTVQFAANSFLSQINSSPAGAGSGAVVGFADSTSGTTDNITAGFRGTDVTRIVTANVARTVGDKFTTVASFTFDFPSSGTVHCLLKF